MKMEISSGFIMDLVLETIGYLAVGAFSIVVYSMFNRRRITTDTEAEGRELIETATAPERRIQFVKFGQKAGRLAGMRDSSRREPDSLGANRRSRAEIIRIAREMMKAGATSDKIKKVLPVSEAELALMNLQEG
jgi:hypothetical protein